MVAIQSPSSKGDQAELVSPKVKDDPIATLSLALKAALS